jgi:hypothetical protein
MTHHQQTDTVPRPPASPGARPSRSELPAARRALRLAAMAAPVPLLLAVAGAASAAPAAQAPTAPARLVTTQAASKNSLIFAGYAVSPGATSVSARFTVPKLACPAIGRLGIRPGVDLGGQNAPFTEAGVLLRCRHGAPAFAASVIIDKRIVTVPVRVKPGDKMAVHVTATATASEASIADLTQRSSVAVGTSTGARNLLATVGVDAVAVDSGLLLGVPPFGAITFRGAKVDGSALGASDPTAINRVKFSTLQIRTGPLDSTGTSFSTTFKHT